MTGLPSAVPQTMGNEGTENQYPRGILICSPTVRPDQKFQHQHRVSTWVQFHDQRRGPMTVLIISATTSHSTQQQDAVARALASFQASLAVRA